MGKKKKNTVGEDIYSGLSQFGSIYALITAIFITLISIFFIVAGIGIIKSSYNDVKRTPRKAKIIKMEMNIVIQYEDGTQKVVLQYPETGTYSVGQIVTVYVSDKDPDDITLVKPLSAWVGVGLIIGCIIVSAISWIWYWATTKSKFIGAVQGTVGIVDIVT
jgi:hypothetical protein